MCHGQVWQSFYSYFMPIIRDKASHACKVDAVYREKKKAGRSLKNPYKNQFVRYHQDCKLVKIKLLIGLPDKQRNQIITSLVYLN